jgi:RimJ/RimL family protein N-acetyltransferase
VQDGRAISICRSVRIGQQAHEAGIETLPQFRGQGHAPIVASAWAAAVHELSRIPLYSASWQNKASQAVAHKLNMHQYAATFHIT